MTNNLLLIAIIFSFIGFACSASSSVLHVPLASVEVPMEEIEVTFISDK